MRTIKKLFILLLAYCCCLAAWGEKLQIVTSFSVLQDMAAQVGGDKVQVRSLVGANGSPHDWQPSPADLQAIKNADVLVVNGLGLEGNLTNLIKSAAFKGKLIVASENVKPLATASANTAQRVYDPHAWNSLSNGVIYLNNIAQALAELRPQDKDYFTQNAGRYAAQLQALDNKLKLEFSALKQQNKTLLISHDALNYFAADYGLKFVAPLGLNSNAEVSANEMAQLIKQFRELKIKIYFTEEQINPRLVQQIAAATGAQLGGELSPESLLVKDGVVLSYWQTFAYNAEQILAAVKK